MVTFFEETGVDPYSLSSCLSPDHIFDDLEDFEKTAIIDRESAEF